MDPTVGLVAASGWGSGLNLYLVTATLGLGTRFGFVDAPEILANPWVIGVAVALFALEFIADKVPYLDSAWDSVHTVVRPFGAALLGYVLTGEAGGAVQLGAAGGSGLLALASHAAKATARAAINTSPEPFSNAGVSLGEDGLVVAVLWLAVTNPLLALAAVLALTVVGLALIVLLWRLVRRRRSARSEVASAADRR